MRVWSPCWKPPATPSPPPSATGDGEALEAAFSQWQADAAIVDIRLPPSHTDEGLRQVLQARRARPGLILIDTSAWVEFLRDTGSPACAAVDRALAAEFAVCDPVVMEVLAGARDERHLMKLRGLLRRGVVLPTTPAHYDAAAAMYRACRTNGETVRKLIDCLIGAVAIAADADVLHADADFDVLSRHTDLRVRGS